MKKLKIFSLSVALLCNASIIPNSFFIKLAEKNVYVKNIFNENGFNTEGIHKDTGTEYDTDGYNIEGYSTGGTSRLECQPHDSNNQVITNSQYWYYSTRYWNGSIATKNSGNLYFTHIDLKDMYAYTQGELIKTDSSNRFYAICRYKVNHHYVENKILHPNISIFGDFKNPEYYVSP
jgi:hypothetical protein